MTQRIDVLGTGNAFLPNGRHHSFSVIDGKHIIDAPPTALASLRRAGIPVSDIESVFVTHVHGDHVFGFPFLLLERKYISDREGIIPLRVVGSSIVKSRLTELCRLAFPGSLDSILETVEWIVDETGTTHDGWTWERFEVLHDDAVDPHGYRFEHVKGGSFVHSGDSGPCKTLYDAIKRADIAILEMGFPDWVPSTHHHKPKDVEALAKLITTPLVITHTFVDDSNGHPKILSEELPDHPPHVHHISDGTRLNWNDGEWGISTPGKS